MKNVMVLQSGGPTSAINATVAGVVERGLISEKVDKIYGARHGIVGVIKGDVVEIGETLASPSAMERFIHTPAAGLGSCRHKLPAIDSGSDEYDAIFKTLKEYNVGYLVCIGGNDSMDTVNKLSTYAKDNKIEGISIMGGPKTIDNDLEEMDHSPGYPSAARYVTSTMLEIWQDCNVYDSPQSVTIVEIMGRHAGWLAAAASYAKEFSPAPHLLYLPEVVFDDDKFLEDLGNLLKTENSVVVAISEGIHYEDGRFVSEGHDDEEAAVDAFGHKRVAGAAGRLEDLINSKFDVKVRAIEFSLLQRAAGFLTSSVDLQESRMLGATSLDRALSGISGQVSVLNRVKSEPYTVKYSSVDVAKVANLEKKVPREWINEEGNGMNEKFIEYIKPLISSEGEDLVVNGLPNHLSFLDY